MRSPVSAPFSTAGFTSAYPLRKRGRTRRPVEAGSGGGSGAAGAPVPARPRPPTLSGGAALDLTLDEDEPAQANPTDVFVATPEPDRKTARGSLSSPCYSMTETGFAGSGSSTMSSAVAWLIQYWTSERLGAPASPTASINFL